MGKLFFELTVDNYNGGTKNIRTAIKHRDDMIPYQAFIHFLLFKCNEQWNYNNATELVPVNGGWKSVPKVVSKYGIKFGKKTVEDFDKKFLKGNVVDRICGARFIEMISEDFK